MVEHDSSARLTGRVDAPLEDVSIGDRVELQVRDPEAVGIDPDFDLSYEEEWPIHVFELGEADCTPTPTSNPRSGST